MQCLVQFKAEGEEGGGGGWNHFGANCDFVCVCVCVCVLVEVPTSIDWSLLLFCLQEP